MARPVLSWLNTCSNAPKVIRQVIPPEELETLVDNIGFPISGTNMTYNNTGTIGSADGEIQIADYEVATEPEINLRDYWDRIWRRRTTVLIVTLGVFILGAFWTFIQKPVYTAKSQLLVEKEPNILSFDQVLQIEAMRDDFYQTQYKLLSGRAPFTAEERAIVVR